MFDSLRSHLPVSWLKIVWVSLLSVCLVMLCLLTSCSNLGNIERPAGGQQTGAANPEANKWLGGFSRVPGTRFLYAQISASKDAGPFSLSSSGYDNSTHNLVYFDPATAKVTRLLPSNDMLIASTNSLPDANQQTALGTSQEPQQVLWFLFGIAKRDTNNDKKITNQDKQVLAVADAGGQGYTELIDNVDQLYGETLNDATTLSVIYRKDGRLFNSTVNLAKRQVTATREFPSLGNDVKLLG